jgi:arylsulfatase A-like enzyme
MLTVSFFATHAQDGEPFETQFQPQNYSAPLYENVTIPTPVTATEKAWQNMPPFFTDQNEGRVRWQVRYETPEMFQYTMKNIYRMASEVDDVVGAIVQELKDQGLYNNTLIIFTTDNGKASLNLVS